MIKQYKTTVYRLSAIVRSMYKCGMKPKGVGDILADILKTGERPFCECLVIISMLGFYLDSCKHYEDDTYREEFLEPCIEECIKIVRRLG